MAVGRSVSVYARSPFDESFNDVPTYQSKAVCARARGTYEPKEGVVDSRKAARDLPMLL